MFKIFIIISFFIINGLVLFAAPSSYLTWKSISTNAFKIHYHPGSERCALQIWEFADTISYSLSAVFNFTLKEPLHVIVRDDIPEPNGEAASDSDLITMWCTEVHSQYRGKMVGLATVFAHELSHIYSLKQQSYFSELSTLTQFSVSLQQGKISEYNGNTDLYVPFPDARRPQWWVEGIAEYGASKVGYNPWTSSREMFLRTNIIDGYLLTWEELQIIMDKKGMMGERVYNTGFSLMNYIEKEYGKEKLIAVGANNAKEFHWNWLKSVEKVLGVPAVVVYQKWLKQKREEVTVAYKKLKRKEGKPAISLYTNDERKKYRKTRERPVGERFFQITPDQTTAIWVTDAWPYQLKVLSDSKKLTLPLAKEPDGKQARTMTIENVAAGKAEITSDKQFVVYSRSVNAFIDIRQQDMIDIYRLSLKDFKEERLTINERSRCPSVSPDGKWLAYASCYDFSCQVRLMEINSTTKIGKPILNQNQDFSGFWIESIRFSPDGKQLAVGFEQQGRTGIGVVDMATNQWSIKLLDEFDNTGVQWTKDGKGFYLASDRDGAVANIYQFNPNNRTFQKLTNVYSGAFDPFVLDKTLYYSQYSAFGYTILQLPVKSIKLLSQKAPIASNLEGLKVTDAGKLKLFKEKSSNYKSLDGNYQPLLFMPHIGIVENRPMGGGVFYITDYFKRHEFYQLIEVGEDITLYSSYTNRYFTPDINLNYSYNRHIERYTYYLPATNETAGSAKDTQFQHFGGLKFTFALSKHLSLTLNNQYKQIQYRSLFDNWNKLATYYKGGMSSLDVQYTELTSLDINPQDTREVAFAMAIMYPLFSGVDAKKVSSPFGSARFLTSYSEYLAIPYFSSFTLEATLTAGWMNSTVHPFEWFRYTNISSKNEAGFTSRTYAASGYDSNIAMGEKLFMASAGLRFPAYQNLNKGALGLWLRSAYVTLFGSMGNAWGADESYFSTSAMNGVQFLRDIGMQIDLENYLFNNFAWFGFLRVTYPLVKTPGSGDMNNDNVVPLGDIEEKEATPVRWSVSLGSPF